MREHDVVVLTRAIPEFGLEPGDVGAVVLVHSETAYEVEFVAANGFTVALLTLGSGDIRPARREVLHARALAT